MSDEFQGDGLYILGLEQHGRRLLCVTSASLAPATPRSPIGRATPRRGAPSQPPVLVPLRAGQPPPAAAASLVLLPDAADRLAGTLELISAEPETPSLFGEGLVEYWLDVPSPADLPRLPPLRRARPAAVRHRDRRRRPERLRHVRPEPHRRRRRARRLLGVPGDGRSGAGPALDAAAGRAAGDCRGAAGTRRGLGACAIPWERYPVPDGSWLGRAEAWKARAALRPAAGGSRGVGQEPGPARAAVRGLVRQYRRRELFAGDAVRLVHAGQWDLEPFGRLRFRFEGQGSGHVVSLWRRGCQGRREAPVARCATRRPAPKRSSCRFRSKATTSSIRATWSPSAWSWTKATSRPTRSIGSPAAIVDPVFDRRDVLALPDGYAAIAGSGQAGAGRARSAEAGQQVEPLRAVGFQPVDQAGGARGASAVRRDRAQAGDAQDAGLRTAHDRGPEHRAATRSTRSTSTTTSATSAGRTSASARSERFRRRTRTTGRALREFEERLVERARPRACTCSTSGATCPIDAQLPAQDRPGAPRDPPAGLRRPVPRLRQRRAGRPLHRRLRRPRAQHTNRREGWDDFVRWDEHVCGDSMNYMNATGSLNFSHYYGERNCRLLGLETAQGLPSDTLMFAFLRGAGKQYGRLTYQATSIWNRFGYNMYHGRKTGHGANGYGFGPEQGLLAEPAQAAVLLQLPRRAQHRRHRDLAVHGRSSCPKRRPGTQPAGPAAPGACASGSSKHPDRGVMYTPVAFMLDFYNGWNMPRHLYRGDKYKIWGKFPYEKGDYLIDDVFRMVWPGYEDCSYLRNERGFLTPTPYGDIFDVITNRCHPEVLKQYSARDAAGRRGDDARGDWPAGRLRPRRRRPGHRRPRRQGLAGRFDRRATRVAGQRLHVAPVGRRPDVRGAALQLHHVEPRRRRLTAGQRARPSARDRQPGRGGTRCRCVPSTTG